MAHWQPALRRGALWWATGVAQLSIFVQVAFGVALVSVEDQPLPEFHAFYGFLAIIAVAIIFSYRSQLKHQLYLLYGLGGLFVMGLSIRAMVLQR